MVLGSVGSMNKNESHGPVRATKKPYRVWKSAAFAPHGAAWRWLIGNSNCSSGNGQFAMRTSCPLADLDTMVEKQGFRFVGHDRPFSDGRIAFDICSP